MIQMTTEEAEKSVKKLAWETLQASIPDLARAVRILAQEGRSPEHIRRLVRASLGEPVNVLEMVELAVEYLAQEGANADARSSLAE